MTSDPNDRPPLLQPRNPSPRNPRDESRPAPLTGEVIRSRPPVDYAASSDYELPPEQPTPLRNPYVLAGLAVAAAIVLAVMVVVLFGSNGSGSGNSNAGGSADQPNGVVVDQLTPEPDVGLPVKSIATSSVRDGPSVDAQSLGTLRAGQDVNVVGRNNDAGWFQIIYPAHSALRGWVPASALKVPDASAQGIPVVVATPIARPTPPPQPTLAPQPTDTAVPPPSVTVAPTPASATTIDLQASIVAGTCAIGHRLVVSVRNAGPGTLSSRAITILVQTVDGVQRALTSQTATLPPDGTIDIDTTYVVQERVFALVDPLNTLGDTNPGNNRVDCIQGAAPTPTRPAVATQQVFTTPTPFTTPLPTVTLPTATIITATPFPTIPTGIH